jgi:hypothetical protein
LQLRVVGGDDETMKCPGSFQEAWKNPGTAITAMTALKTPTRPRNLIRACA